MKLKFERPVVWMDIESTGIDRDNDRIIELSLCIVQPDLSRKTYTRRMNPGIPIPAGASEVHGIYDDDVKDEPTFSMLAKGLLKLLEGCDLGGFNSNSYDVPMLYAEFKRAGIDWDWKQHLLLDAGNLFKIKEPRTLSAAVQKYCGKELEGAHGAEADILATVDVFLAQMDLYENDEEFPQTVEDLALYMNYGKRMADIAGKFSINDEGNYVLEFGKHKGELAQDHIDFLEWMIGPKATFNRDTCDIALQIINESYAQR
jgi:DNA polymerase-3 subunit epsilon